MTAPKRRDERGNLVGKRSENGRPDTGMTEATQLVRGPEALISAMRARAKAEGVPLVVLWRRAAERLLNG